MTALFDLDGVLIDTEGTYSTFWSAMGKKYHAGVPNFANVIKGTTLRQILNGYFDPKDHEAIVDELVDFERNMRYVIFPGVIDFLRQLKSEGVKTAIVTSSGDLKLGNLYAQHPDFRGYFDVVISDAQVTRSKPDPEGYLLAAEALGAKPEECWVFEDSYNGLEAGRRAGAKVVALSTTNPAEKLAPLADIVIPGFDGNTLIKIKEI